MADTYETEASVIRMGFEYELCAECGGDLDAHTIAPDALGHAHAWCNSETTFTRRRDAIAWLTKDGPQLRVPCSRYGSTSADCAPVAWRLAYIVARETGEWPITAEQLDHAMSLVVNDHDDVAHVIRQHGHRQYR